MVQILANSIIDGIYISAMAICFGLIYNTLKVFHIAFGSIFTLSCYLVYQGLGIFSFIIILILAFLIERYIYSPLNGKKASSSSIFIASLGINIVIVNFVALFWGNETKILHSALDPTFQLGSIIFSRQQIYLLLVSTLFVFFYIILLDFYKLGQRVIAVGGNPMLSASVGINSKAVRTFIIIITTLLSSVLYLFKAYDVGLDPYSGLNVTLLAAIAYFISGGRNYYYLILTGLILSLLRGLSTWFISSQWMEAVTFLLLLTFLIYKNQGFYVDKKRLEETI